MKVLIVGANGKVGTLLCGKLWGAHDFSPVALIRDHRQQTKFTGIGVPAVTGDLEEGISKFLPGLDAVVFTAGSGSRTGPDKTTDVDQNAAIRFGCELQIPALKLTFDEEVDVAVAIGIDLVDHVLELGLRGGLPEGPHHRAQLLGRDGSIAVLVEQGERLLELRNLLLRKLVSH